MAQSNVYSLNVVGYYNVTVPAGGYYMVANQLNTTNNTLGGLIPAPADGSQFYKYNGGYTTATFDALGGAWDLPGVTLNPGEAGFFKDPTGGAGQVLTFVGEVLQGTLVNTLPVGNSVRSSIVPQQATLTVLGVPAEDGDQAYVYNGGYATSTYDGLAAAWDTAGSPGGPTINVGQGFFYKKAAGGTATSWVRNFTVQ